jgi:hypothetical protein
MQQIRQDPKLMGNPIIPEIDCQKEGKSKTGIIMKRII